MNETRRFTLQGARWTISALLALSSGVAFADAKSGEAKSFLCDLCHNTGTYGEAAGSRHHISCFNCRHSRTRSELASCRPMPPA